MTDLEVKTYLQGEIDRINHSYDEKTRDFEIAFTKLMMDKEAINIYQKIKCIKEMLKEDYPDAIKYGCFVMANIYYRRVKDHTVLNNLIHEYGSTFKKHESYLHYYLLTFVDRGYQNDWREILNLAEKNADLLNHEGARHMFAEFVAMYFESDMMDATEAEKKEWLQKAMRNIYLARKLDPSYAKFMCTEGRLDALLGQYDEAIENIRLAIDKEDSEKNDYALRIGNYQVSLLNVERRKNMDKIEETMTVMMEESENVKGSLMRNLEYLGIFSGIISFTMGSISLAASTATISFFGAAGLIIILFGSLVGVYGMFDLIIHGCHKKKALQYMITILVVVIAIIGGLYLCSTI